MGSVIVLTVSVVGIYIVAVLVRSSVKFVHLLSGMALVQVMATLFSLALALAAFLPLLLGHAIGILPGEPAEYTSTLFRIAGYLFRFVFYIYFLMGAFDVGCLIAFLLGLLAHVISMGVGWYFLEVLVKALGG